MKKNFFLMIISMIFILACGLPMMGGATPPPPMEEVQPISPIQIEELPTTAISEIDPVPIESTENPVQHIAQPGEPNRIRTWVTDRSSAQYASEHRSVADGFDLNIFERPFTAGEMQYQPYLDLTKVEVGEGGEWIYVVFHLEGNPPAGVEAFYAIEIDTDRDGRGDWLIGAMAPPSTTWTTDGVKVWHDSNNDVGGTMPMLSEAPLAGINRYDELIFDNGHGNDPDTAWGRIDPASTQRIQVAFKHSVIGSADTFLFGGWSDEGVKEAGWFDYNDHFTLAEAGSPLINSNDYPLAALFSVDNTCRWSYGFEPTTAYPGLCPLPEPTAIPPTSPPPDESPAIPEISPSCDPPPQGCGENSSWVGYPDCYCAPY
ncbi:MAG: hypothetical protein JEZ00_14790 [Anaerolineaceae bacterium]|nr:hypothetical protein [Anaerolineaceae bacterium]